MSLLDYISLTLFVVLVFVSGMAFSRKQKDVEGYFSADGAVPWGMCGLSLFMGFFSAATFVVWGSIGYTHGAVAIVIQETMCIAGIVVGMFIAPKWHDTGCHTAAEYISLRFGRKTRKTYSILFLLVSLFTTGAFIYPVARILDMLTGLSFPGSVLLIGAFCITYVSLGGLWSVVATDVLQFVILTAAVIILAPLAIDKAGGTWNFFHNAPDGFFNPADSEYTWLFIVAFGIYNAVYLAGNWAFVQRYTSVRTRSNASRAVFLFAGLYLVCPVLWMLPSMAFRLADGTLTGVQDEGAFLLMCRQALPKGLLGMMTGGIVFATASSFNQVLNVASGVIAYDILGDRHDRLSQSRILCIARWSTVFIGLLSLGVALFIPSMGGIVNFVISIAALTGVPLYLPVVWSLFSRRQTRRSIMTVTFVSLAANVLMKFAVPALTGFSLDRTWEMVSGVSLPVLMLAVWEIAGKDVAAPLQINRDRNGGDNSFGLLVTGFGMLLAGILVLVNGIITDHHNGLVIIVGLVMAAAGALPAWPVYKKMKHKR